MPAPSSNDSPELDIGEWLAGLGDHELERALDRMLAEITKRHGAAATSYVGDALMRRFF